MFSEQLSKRTTTILGLENPQGWLIQLDTDQLNHFNYEEMQALVLRGHPVYLNLPGARVLSSEAKTQLTSMGVPFIEQEQYAYGLAGHLLVDPINLPNLKLDLDAKVLRAFSTRAFQHTLELFMNELQYSPESLSTNELLEHIRAKKNHLRIIGMLSTPKQISALYQSANTLNKHIYPTIGRYALSYLDEFGYQIIKH